MYDGDVGINAVLQFGETGMGGGGFGEGLGCAHGRVRCRWVCWLSRVYLIVCMRAF